MNLHNKIMNLPCHTRAGYSEYYVAGYKFGHRDARHAAAELSLDADRLVRAARAVLARWDSPGWKDTAPTADVMAELRKAVEECE